MNRKTLHVVVASTNPVKVKAALGGFEKMFADRTVDVVPLSVPSGVADQPMTDAETLEGALNRVQQARYIYPEADFWVGIEGGVEVMGNELAAFAWIVVRSATGILGKARSGTFFLPPAVAGLVAQGMELGHANDKVFSRHNSKQQGGAIGSLTDQVLDRRQLYEPAVVLALVPFKNQALYAAPAGYALPACPEKE
ncbi:inosine/xanthosine triphosphatase [Pontibacter liquoris]|uniref:inosine/xanthosine triphosphatase n=1 Tax=Pontibacter liquoris TaxID=2905677 RepID=UPI001FA7173D|nr:inosine/xanthosine triphosphatase [Pontibacter liquoris]